MDEFLGLILFLWVLFMVSGIVIVLTYMMWSTLRSIIKGEW